jgi:Helix-turn-helix domain
MSEPFLGAHVAGWSAFALDLILRRYRRDYAPVMNPAHQREMEATRGAIHAAALLWGASTSASATTQTPATEITPRLESEELTTSQAAMMLNLSEQRVRQLAARWTAEGLARKVGRAWLIDRTAVEMYRDKDRRSAA